MPAPQESKEIEIATENAKDAANLAKLTVDTFVDTAERFGQATRRTVSAALGVGLGAVVGIGIIATEKVPLKYNDLFLGAMGAIGGSVGALVVKEGIEEKKRRLIKQIDEIGDKPGMARAKIILEEELEKLAKVSSAREMKPYLSSEDCKNHLLSPGDRPPADFAAPQGKLPELEPSPPANNED